MVKEKLDALMRRLEKSNLVEKCRGIALSHGIMRGDNRFNETRTYSENGLVIVYGKEREMRSVNIVYQGEAVLEAVTHNGTNSNFPQIGGYVIHRYYPGDLRGDWEMKICRIAEELGIEITGNDEKTPKFSHEQLADLRERFGLK
ncbi:hypothetical protein ACFL0X_01990 [Nanoarchaeota archaeon]